MLPTSCRSVLFDLRLPLPRCAHPRSLPSHQYRLDRYWQERQETSAMIRVCLNYTFGVFLLRSLDLSKNAACDLYCFCLSAHEFLLTVCSFLFGVSRPFSAVFVLSTNNLDHMIMNHNDNLDLTFFHILR